MIINFGLCRYLRIRLPDALNERQKIKQPPRGWNRPGDGYRTTDCAPNRLFLMSTAQQTFSPSPDPIFRTPRFGCDDRRIFESRKKKLVETSSKTRASQHPSSSANHHTGPAQLASTKKGHSTAHSAAPRFTPSRTNEVSHKRSKLSRQTQRESKPRSSDSGQVQGS